MPLASAATMPCSFSKPIPDSTACPMSAPDSPMEDLFSLEQQLQVEFYDYDLLSRALTHRSFLNENPDIGAKDNARLEFFGDAVLDLVVGAYLYQRFPNMSEGEMTALRAA